MRQAADPQLVGQLGQRVVARRVRFKGPAHEWCPFLVDHDGARLAAGHHLADIAVADGGDMRRAAGLDLLLGAFDDLVRKFRDRTSRNPGAPYDELWLNRPPTTRAYRVCCAVI